MPMRNSVSQQDNLRAGAIANKEKHKSNLREILIRKFMHKNNLDGMMPINEKTTRQHLAIIKFVTIHFQ